MSVLYLLIEFFILGIWAVLGFLLWIPLLTRMMTAFVGTVIMSLYTNSDITRAKTSLEAAVTFYSRGFRLISDALQNKLEGHNFNDASDARRPERDYDTEYLRRLDNLRRSNFWHAVGQVLYSMTFWGLTWTLTRFF